MQTHLRPLKGEVTRKRFLTLDIESKDGPSRVRPGFTRPFMVGVHDGEEYVEFRDLDPEAGAWDQRYFHADGCVARAMRHVLQQQYAGWHVYAHNAGRFDYLHLLPWLMAEGERLGYSWTLIPVASSIQLLDVFSGPPSRDNQHHWRFLDSFKLIPTSFDKACKGFGLPGKVDHRLDLHELDPKWSPYLKQDCVGLYALLTKFHDYVENVLGGEVGMTAPSTAIKLLRRKYLKEPIPRSIDTHDFVRLGYFGGRVEDFIEAGDGLRYYDINSSYPRSMLELMPVGEGQWIDGEPPAWMMREWIGFCDVDVEVPEDVIVPPLPVRLEDVSQVRAGGIAVGNLKGKLLFPVGRLRGVWEWSELSRALELGCTIRRWGRSVWYAGQHIFRDFVVDIYRHRDRSLPGYDEGLAQTAKIMLNSAYGKFGMKTERRTIHRYDDPNLPENAVAAWPDPDCPIYYVDKVVDAPYIMPQISARVTALSRVRLLDGMVESIQREGRVWYCDTDSMLTNVKIATSTELGAWKDEFPEHSGQIRGRFIGPKLYVLTVPGSGWEYVKAKGFEQRSVELLERLSRGETIVQKRLEKVGTMARNGFATGPKMRAVPRSLHLATGKREKLGDGTTRPWRLEMF